MLLLPNHVQTQKKHGQNFLEVFGSSVYLKQNIPSEQLLPMEVYSLHTCLGTEW